MQSVFELTGVNQRFGVFPVLKDINIQIGAGEHVALVGPSGAGKSTLIRLLNGTLFPTDGSVRALGQDVFRLNSRQLRRLQRQIGTIYQQFHLVETMRVIHNVNAGRLGSWSTPKALLSLFWPRDVDIASQALFQVGIPEKLYALTHQLSGGQQQRVAIARVLVQNPKVILADEPISNLDRERGRDIMDLLLNVCVGGKTTLIATLHAVEFALSHFQRVIGLREGRILFDAPAPDVSDAMIKTLYQIAPVS